MKRVVALILVVMLVLSVPAMAMPKPEGAIYALSSIKILAIGNSFSVDSMAYLYDILTDMGAKNIVLGNLYIGGCSLETHAKNIEDNAEKYTYYKCSEETDGKWETIEGKKSVLYALKDEEWNYVSLQQASGYSGIASSYEPYLTQIIDYVKENTILADVNLMWNMTWAYQGDSNHNDFPKYANSQDIMYRSIVNAVQTQVLPHEEIDFVIPCGTAVQNMRSSACGDTLTRDGYHMNKVYGRYLLSTMWAKRITSDNLMYLSTFPQEDGGITPLMLDSIKEAVENAYEKPYEVINSVYRAAGDRVDYAQRSADACVDVTNYGTYDAATGIFSFDKNGSVARNGVDIAYLGTQAASLNGQPCAYVDGRFYVPQSFLDYRNGTKYTPVEEDTFEADLVVEKNGDKWLGIFSLTNYLTGFDVTGDVTIIAPESLKGTVLKLSQPTSGFTSTATFDIPSINESDNYYDFAFDYIVAGKTYSYQLQEEITFADRTDGIVIDGVMSEGEWNESYAINTATQAQAANLKDWAGTTDISAKSYVAWDDDKIYFAGISTDNVFTPAQKLNLLWEGDSLQFGIYHDTTDGRFVPGDADKNFHEIGLALVDGKAGAYKSLAQAKGSTTGVIENADVAITNSGAKTIYEFSMTWEELLGYDYTPKADDIIGFSVLYNDNDGNGRRGWIEYGGGIGGAKSANEFSQMYLVGAPAAIDDSDEIKVYVNGEKLTFDQPPVIVDDRTLVPVRAIFEALGAVVMWNDASQTALAIKDDLQITIKIGVNVMMANDKEIPLDVPAQLINDRTLVPLRAIAEALGNTVEWDDATQTVTITE